MFELVMYKRRADGTKTNQRTTITSVDGKDLAKFFVKTTHYKKRVKK